MNARKTVTGHRRLLKYLLYSKTNLILESDDFIFNNKQVLCERQVRSHFTYAIWLVLSNNIEKTSSKQRQASYFKQMTRLQIVRVAKGAKFCKLLEIFEYFVFWKMMNLSFS